MSICVCVCVCVQLLSHVWFFVTPWTVTQQASLSFTISLSLLRLIPIESVMPSNHLILWSKTLLNFPSAQEGLKKISFRVGKVIVHGVDCCLLWIPPANKAQKTGEQCSWQPTKVKMKSILSCQLAPLLQFNKYIIVNFAATDMPVMVQNHFCFSPNSVRFGREGFKKKKKKNTFQSLFSNVNLKLLWLCVSSSWRSPRRFFSGHWRGHLAPIPFPYL